MSNIPDLTPNANIANGIFDEPIRVDSINVTDIKIDKPCNCCCDSMAPNNVESIGDIKINL